MGRDPELPLENRDFMPFEGTGFLQLLPGEHLFYTLHHHELWSVETVAYVRRPKAVQGTVAGRS